MMTFVGADVVIAPESRTAAIDGGQIDKGIMHAFGPGHRLPAVRCLFLGVGYEDAVMVAVADGNVCGIDCPQALTHKDAQVVCDQNGITDDVVIESQVERNAGTGIVVEIKSL